MIGKRLLEISNKNPVRRGVYAGHQERMDPENMLNAGGQDIHLSAIESEEIEKNILEFMRTHPVKGSPGNRAAGSGRFHDDNPGAWEVFRSLFFHVRPLSLPPLIAAVIVVLSTSLSVAARSALPGDFLYPVKIHVNESVEGVFHVSAGSHAQFEADRLAIRLEEAGELAASGRLHGTARTDVAGGITAQLERAQTAAATLAVNGDVAAALEMHSQMESDLVANAAVLGTVADAQASVEDDVRGLLENVSSAERSAQKIRVSTEVKAAGGAQANLQTTAEAAMKTATERIDGTRVFMDEVRGVADTQIFAQADARFSLSKRILANARAQLDQHLYPEAFRLAKEAQRTAQEAKSMLKVSAALQQSAGGAMKVDVGL